MIDDSESNTIENDDWLENILKIVGIGLGAYAGTKLITNKIVDKKRSPILQHLPKQNLNWIENSALRGFFRKHNFYVTQFPLIATEILYWSLKYLGALELNKTASAYTAKNKLWWICNGETLQDIENLKGKSLETIFKSLTFRRIFSLPPCKRMDVEFFDPKSNPIRLVHELREELWTPGELYPYLDNKKYLVHIYDLGEYKFTHFLPQKNKYINHQNWQGDIINIFTRIRNFRHKPLERDVFGKRLPWVKNTRQIDDTPHFKHSWNFENLEEHQENLAIAHYTLNFRNRAPLSGFLFSLSGKDSPELMEINHQEFRKVFCTTQGIGEGINDRMYDAERKILLALYHYIEGDWKNLRKIDMKLYTEDHPCHSCKPILKRFKELKKDVSLGVWALKLRGNTLKQVRRRICNGESHNFQFKKIKL